MPRTLTTFQDFNMSRSSKFLLENNNKHLKKLFINLKINGLNYKFLMTKKQFIKIKFLLT